jgi:predicted aminopeptidase
MRLLISIPILLLLTACADFGYYWHSAGGHLSLMNKRVDIDEILSHSSLDDELRARLLLVQEIRKFSIERLTLPDNGSYDSYVELDRPYVLQNLFAAKEFSTRLHRWCYPIIGCTSYRGYYDEERLQNYVETLQKDGLEVYISPVSAYSTLGWFDDPVLSSFIDWPDHRLAGLLFHELTHQRVYIADDTEFNESLASAVQQAGILLWLESENQATQLDNFHRWLIYRNQVLALIGDTRDDLAKIYQQEIAAAEKRRQKTMAFERARLAHAVIAQQHGIRQGFTRWFASELNNAKIGSIATYSTQVPAFTHMIQAHSQNFDSFFSYVEKLGNLEKPIRDACLEAWSKQASGEAITCSDLARISHQDDGPSLVL